MLCRRSNKSQVDACLDCNERCLIINGALDLARRGLRPIPMFACDKRPALRGWRALTTTDPDKVASLFERAPRADGLAIATGDGVFVLDLDRNHGGGADGVESCSQLIDEHGEGEALPPGPRVLTPRRGLHLYLRSPSGRTIRNRVGLAPGVDVKGHGGLAIAPPSVGYRWISSFETQEIPDAPLWLVELVDPLVAARPVSKAPSGQMPLIANVSAYAHAALEGELASVANAKPGERNSRLFKAAARLGSLIASGYLPCEPVANALIEAAAVSGLVADDGMTATRATIASGLTRGLESPRALPPVT